MLRTFSNTALVSNDKSTVRVMPLNASSWHIPSDPLFVDLNSHRQKFTQIIYQLGNFMQSRSQKVVKATYKYMLDFYFPYFNIQQSTKAPFHININLNIIQANNQTGFNYIIKPSKYEELKPFVQDIIDLYVFYLEEFVLLLRDKWELLKNSKGEFINSENDRYFIDFFYKHFVLAYKNNPKVILKELSVTCDYHFDNARDVYFFKQMAEKIQIPKYKKSIHQDWTTFLKPTDATTLEPIKTLPKIRLYDKQSDLIDKFYKHQKKDFRVAKLKYSSLVEDNWTEQYDLVSVFSQDMKNINDDFLRGFNFLNNTIRFEIEFSDKAIKKRFKSNDFFNLHINNELIIEEYLKLVFDQEKFDYNEVVFHDQVTEEKHILHHKGAFVDKLEASGDILDMFNFVIQHADFLNEVLFLRNHQIYKVVSKDLKRGQTLQLRKTKLSSSSSLNSLYSKLKRFRERGVFSGNASNVRLNKPYDLLLEVHNYYLYNSILERDFFGCRKEVKPPHVAGEPQSGKRRSTAGAKPSLLR